MSMPDRLINPNRSNRRKQIGCGAAILLVGMTSLSMFMAPVIVYGLNYFNGVPSVRFESYEPHHADLTYSGPCYESKDPGLIPRSRSNKLHVLFSPQGTKIEMLPNWPCTH